MTEKELMKRAGVSRSTAHYFLHKNPGKGELWQYIKDCKYLSSIGLQAGHKVYRRGTHIVVRVKLKERYGITGSVAKTAINNWMSGKVNYYDMHKILQDREAAGKDSGDPNWGTLSDNPRPWNLFGIDNGVECVPNEMPEDEIEYFRRLAG